MKMRYLTTAALIFGGAILASQSVFGQVAANNLYFGFQNQAGSGTQDYIINLGPAANIIGKSSVVDLSGDFSLTDFNAVLGGSSSLFGGVVGASNAGNPSDVFATQLRNGAPGTPSVAGSSAPGGLTKTQDSSVYSGLGGLAAPASGTGMLDTTKSWEADVEPGYTVSGGTPGAGSFVGVTGLNPDSTVSPSSVLYEDLWYTSSSTLTGSKPFVYLGFFTLDLTGASPKLTFTSTNVPGTLTGPIIASINRVGSTVTLISSNAVPTHSYQLQYTTSLNPANWTSIGSPVVANGTTVTNTDSTATDSKRFYQIQAQ